MRPRQLVLPLGVTVVLAQAVGAPPARAQGSDIALRIDCPALDEASRAALEARARAELTSAPLPNGQVVIRCAGDAATLAWQPTGEGHRERSVKLEPDAGSTVEALLGALDTLVFEKPGGGATPKPESASAPVAPSAVSSPNTSTRDLATPEGRSPFRAGLSLGVDSELWHGALPGAVGIHGGGRLQAGGGWSVTLAAGVLWGMAAQGISSRTLRVIGGVDYVVVPHVRLGLAADGRVMTVEGDASLAPAALDATTAGALASARYLLQVGALELSAGPQAEVLARPIIVESQGGEIFRLPSVMVGFALEAGADFGL